jgi:hypothetical protein
MNKRLVACSIEMVGVHATIETGTVEEVLEENGQEITREVHLAKGQRAFHVIDESVAFVVAFTLPSMIGSAVRVIKKGRFDSFKDKCGPLKIVRPKYDIFVQYGSEVFVGNPRKKSTWQCLGYSFTGEPQGEVIHHYEGRSIYEIRLRWADGRVKRVNVHRLKDQGRGQAISGVLQLLTS